MQHCGGSPQQFCLRWNNYQSNLTNVFDQLLQSESFVDVTLACDNHSVKAHKMVLSACSPYFQSLFFDNPCQHPIVILKDIKWPELKAVVEFMYKGEINVSQEQIGPLLKVAESLKIRGLADVNGEPDSGLPPPAPGDGGGGGNKKWEPRQPQDLSETAMSPSPSQLHRHKKRRRVSGERSTPASSPEQHVAAAADALETSALELGSPHNAMANNLPPPPPPPPPSNHPMGPTMVPLPGDQGLSLPPPSHPDEMEIKPGIAEMIREEERAKMLESSHAWLGASTSSIATDSYQYQLQSMWQKCWNTNQSLVHNLRFRERGPLKSWRPETMAEAIFSVLREGLSLSQAARKYDIPYPTFVLYANRVHNMLGPSADGGADLRPKGRGRPQRILLGSWPEDHINGVIRTVVFRDTSCVKEEPMSYSVGYPGASCHAGNSEGGAVSAAVAAVAQGLRQQMCGLVPGLLLPSNGALRLASPPTPPSPGESGGSPHPLQDVEVGIGVSGMTYKPTATFTSPRPETLFQEDIEDIVKSPTPEMVISNEPKDMIMKMEPLMESQHE